MEFFIFIISIYCTYFTTLKLLPFFRKNFGQIPNERSSHNKLTPSGGGLIFVVISILISLFNNYYRLLIYLPLALIGIFDDKYDLKPIYRYGAQFLTVLFIVFISLSKGFLISISNNISDPSIFGLIFISIIFGTALINFINFMDGIDGLIGGTTFIFLITASFINNNLLALAGCLLGFLILNWSPAKIFMGDVGSTFLGSVIVGEIFINKSFNESFGLLLIISPVLLDAFLCVLRRFFAKQNIFKPHKLHLYQRLCSNGWSHAKVTSIYILSSILISLAYIIVNLETAFVSLIVISLIGLLLDWKCALPFKKAIRLP